MPGKPNRRGDRDTRKVERAIVLQVLRDDHVERWSREELVGELLDVEPVLTERALMRLERGGLVYCDGPHVRAAPAARHLDSLELVSV